MKRVTIVGVGAGSLTLEAAAAIGGADVLFGAARMIEAYDKPKFAEYAPARVAQLVADSDAERFAALVSGDPGFYSAAKGLVDALDGVAEVNVVPGVSSLSAFAARLMRPWENWAIVSCHGRSANLVDAVRRNRETFVLTGGSALAATLCAFGFDELTVRVGENLGAPNERVFATRVRALQQISSLSVLLIENPSADARVRSGIPDSEFVRGDVPMTKSEVRAVTLSKLALAPDSVCVDVGAGTGSVTVEMALAAYRGTVYAVERDAAAVELIRSNCRKFQVGNVEIVSGDAPDSLETLPPFDAAFIGGSGGNFSAIVDAVLGKNANARIVINAVTLKTANAAIAALTNCGLAPEVVQLSVARASERAGLLTAQNPIFVISGGGRV